MDPIYSRRPLPLWVIVLAILVLGSIAAVAAVVGGFLFIGYLVWLGIDYILRCAADCAADIYDATRGR